MAGEIKLEVIKKTQNTLGKYVTKPPLTEKLLRKPPFRFLHDIISAVIKETGFLEGLFSEEEMNSDFKDKEAKIAYLTKLINVVKLVTGIELTARPVKIVCGQEPTKTNQLLQVIANALDKNISSVEAVEHYRTNVEPNVKRISKSNSPSHEQRKMGHELHTVHGKKVTKHHENDHKSTRAHVGPTVRQHPAMHDKMVEDNHGLSTGKDRSTKNVKMVDDTIVSFKRSSNISTANKSGKRKVLEVESTQRARPENDDVQAEVGEILKSTLPSEVDSEHMIDQNDGGDDSTRDVCAQGTESNPEAVLGNKTPRSDESILPLHEDVEVFGNMSEATKPGVSEQPVSTGKHLFRPPSGRPSSARPAAPKLRWKPEPSIKSNELVLMENELVILDNSDSQDDDKESMVVVQTDTHGHPAAIDVNIMRNGDVTQEHGYLVAQILETQKELAKITTVDHVPHKLDRELEGGSVGIKENTVQEVDKLREKIQILTRTTNPMGNLLDFWQEDVEIMQKELFEWRNQFRQQYNHLKIEKTSPHVWAKQSEESLSEIKQTIDNEHNKIYQMKLNIVKNNHKIQQLLDGRA